MKTLYTKLKTILFCFSILASVNTEAQTINEGFEEAVWVSAGAAEANQTRNVTAYGGTGTYGTGNWIYNCARIVTANTASSNSETTHSGTKAIALGGSGSAYILTPVFTEGVTVISFWMAPSNAGTGVTLFVGTNTTVTATGSLSCTTGVGASNAMWSGLTSWSANTADGLGFQLYQYTITGSQSTNPCWIKISRSTGGSPIIDDITITTPNPTSPNLSVSPSSLSGFTYAAGSGPSTSQTFTVSGTNLTVADVVVTAPANYQVSLDNVTFTNSVNIVHGAGVLAPRTVYARLIAGLAVNTYNGNVTTAGGGVVTGPTVALSGDVTAPAVPTITTANTAKTFVSCPSATDTETILVQGSLLTANVTMTLAGAGAARYSLAPSAAVPFATANGGGQLVTITYTGTAAPAGPHVATLTLASVGATSVVINLSGTTLTCYTLITNVSPLGSGVVSVDPSMAAYPSGTVVTLTANAAVGYAFNNWTGDASGGANTTVTMNANKNVTANFVVALPPPPTVNCLTEGWEGVVEVSSPTGGVDEFLDDGEVGKQLALSSGVWLVNGSRIETSSQRSGAKVLRIYDPGSYIESPTLDNPQTFEFWIHPESAYSGVAEDGYKLWYNGSYINSNVTVDGVAAVFDGFGRITSNSTTYKHVVVTLNSSAQGKFRIYNGVISNGRDRYYIDDVSVQCSGMTLEANPNQTELNYVLGTGPSAMKPIVISGADLSVSSGVVTLSNLGDFEVSFDFGSTWQTGAGVTFPFTSNNFVKVAYVRLKTGKALGSYNRTITFTTPSYTKTPPTILLAGIVSAVASSPDCDDIETLSNLIGKSNIESDLNVLVVDEIISGSWTYNTRVSVTRKSGVNYVRLQNESSGVKGILTSPTITFGNYQADKFTISLAPTGTTAVNVDVKYSIDGGASWVLMQQVTTGTVSNYFQTYEIDLSPFPIGSSAKFRVTPNNNYEVIISNFITTAKTKRRLESSEPILSGFESHVNCPSETQSFVLTGTCLEDDGTIDFTSTHYEFSTSATGPFGNSISYTGSFPGSGVTVYVRQKGAATVETNIVEPVIIDGAGVSAGSALQLYMLGNITAPNITSPEPNQVFNFKTPNAVSTRKVIDIEALGMCADFTVTTSGCGTITTAGCEAGPYAAGTTISKDFDNKKIYLQYTPGGAIVNCRVRLTSGILTQDFYVNWSGYAAGAQVLVAEKATMTANLIGIPNPVTATPAVNPAAVVTITSSAGAGTGFEFSVGNPGYGDFVPISSTIAGNLGNLYIRKKPATATGTTETITLSSGGVTSAVFTVTAQ